MKRIILTAVLLFGATLGAHADTAIQTYHDVLRPNGHKRSEAIFQADLATCSRQTGGKRVYHDTPAFKQCMRGRGYTWMSLRIERTPAPARQTTRDQTWIDPETGLTCHDILGGFGSSCSNF